VDKPFGQEMPGLFGNFARGSNTEALFQRVMTEKQGERFAAWSWASANIVSEHLLRIFGQNCIMKWIS
jgi:hypothetical protein